uniref:Uncharacterized protein n=1 Tax=Anguilla anguilla TaxID=7936 RepID=A0A0E9QXQ3_ANGAN
MKLTVKAGASLLTATQHVKLRRSQNPVSRLFHHLF